MPIVSVGKVRYNPDALYFIQLKADMSYVYHQLKVAEKQGSVDISKMDVFKKMAYHYDLTLNEMYQNMMQYRKSERQ